MSVIHLIQGSFDLIRQLVQKATYNIILKNFYSDSSLIKEPINVEQRRIMARTLPK